MDYRHTSTYIVYDLHIYFEKQINYLNNTVIIFYHEIHSKCV